MGHLSLAAILVIACAAPFACGLTGRTRVAPIAPGVLAGGYLVSYLEMSPSNETRGVALFIALVIAVIGACGWAIGALMRKWRANRV